MYLLNSFKNTVDPKFLNVAFISFEKSYSICKAKSTQVWNIEQTNLIDPSNNKMAGSMIEARLEEDLGLSKVILPKKYSNFSNIFDKTWANTLLAHN